MYLTEDRLGHILTTYLPQYEFIRDKAIPNSRLTRFRPDYRCEKLKLLIEFNGYSHYCNPVQILNDYRKAEEWQRDLGYTLISIPYFVQMCDNLIEKITFGICKSYKQEYPHGFIDKKAVLPSFFCELGVQRFVEDLHIFEYAKKDIIISLKDRIGVGDKLKVIPPSLTHLLK